MYKLIPLLLCLALGACVQKPNAPAVGVFRKPGAPIWSNAQLDLSRLPGRWRQAVDFAAEEGGCRPGGAAIERDAAGLRVAARLCLSGVETQVAGPMVPTGPGRFRVGDQEWWVIWVDADYRTLAIGTPSGAFGFVLNRDGNLPPDRMRAAREIFDFNGYDIRRMTAL